MPKLKRFKNQNEKKISTKNLFIAFGIILMIMGGVIISKSYAIYKMQREFDVIKTQIGSYSMGDIRVAVMVDGKEASEFPSYETNYKVEKIECTNGVNASFDVKNWQVNIADMSATSTKCTVYFNSNETNSETPISYSKEELIAINESLTDEFQAKIEANVLNKTYPIGSIYMSTTEDTVEKVQSKFGGTWVKYSEGRTLIGVGNNGTSTYTANQTGGSETHRHLSPLTTYYTNGSWYIGRVGNFGSIDSTTYSVWGATQSIDNEHVPASTSKTVFYTNKESNISPYTAVYMYKRTA